MKKKILLSILLFTILLSTGLLIYFNLNNHTRDYSHYDPEKAIAYSYAYAYDRNPDFPNYEKNCVCFVSQCLWAGGLEMDGSNTDSITRNKIKNTKSQWFCYSFDNDPNKPLNFYLSSSFSSARYFVSYWTKTANVPFTIIENTETNKDIMRNNVKPGDILILYGTETTHAALIVKVDDEDIYYNSNTTDRIEYPLSRVSESDYPTIGYLNFVK